MLRSVVWPSLSVLLLVHVSAVAGQQLSELCRVLECSFDRDDRKPLCNWVAGETTVRWKNGGNIDGFNVFTNVYKDADAINRNKTRGHAEAMGGGPNLREKGLTLTSQEFEVTDKAEIMFKYWLATFGTSLRLCLDDAKCSCPSAECLFETSFDADSKPMTDEGPLRAWRPCAKSATAAFGWDCTTKHMQAAPLPTGKHKLHFVADGVSKYASIGVDSIFVKEEGEKQACGPRKSVDKVKGCYQPVQYLHPQQSTLAKASDENWDGTKISCENFCSATTLHPDETKRCKAFVYLEYKTEPNLCLLYSTTCTDEPDKCAADTTEVSQYYEKRECKPNERKRRK